jgi:hypothetical protein
MSPHVSTIIFKVTTAVETVVFDAKIRRVRKHVPIYIIINITISTYISISRQYTGFLKNFIIVTDESDTVYRILLCMKIE